MKCGGQQESSAISSPMLQAAFVHLTKSEMDLLVDGDCLWTDVCLGLLAARRRRQRVRTDIMQLWVETGRPGTYSIITSLLLLMYIIMYYSVTYQIAVHV